MCHREDLHPREMVYKGILVYLCSKGEKVGNKPDHFTFMENIAAAVVKVCFLLYRKKQKKLN